MHKLTGFIALLLLASSNLCAQLNIFYVDVGQGDSEYIELPSGKNVLIDGGPAGDPIYKFLKAKGVTKIDYMVMTHPHSDHFVGLKKILNTMDVKNFYDSRMENIDAQGDNEVRALAKAEPGCTTHYPEAGEMLNWDPKVKVKVLSNCTKPVQSNNNDETNDCSIVISMSYNKSNLLFMGDAEQPIEDNLIRDYKADLPAYALKVGHHGSRGASSTEFLNVVRPKVAIISVGVDNVYGHPHKEALDRLRAVGAKIFMTMNGGTQSLVIPAPKKGVEPIIEGPTPYDPAAIVQPAAVRDVIFTPPVEAPISVNGEALQQLQGSAK